MSFLVSRLTHLPRLAKIIILLIIIGIGFGIYRSHAAKKAQTPQYQTTTVQKGTLISSISGSGTITSGNSTNITTAASGTVTHVYVKNGDTVKKGQKIADITLDEEGQSQRSAYYIKYLDASEAVKTAQAARVAADIQMWQDHQAHLDALEDLEYKNNNTINPDTGQNYTETEKMVIDKSVDRAYLTFKASEMKYGNSLADIDNAKIQQTAAWTNYQQYAPTITAPADGVIGNLSLAPGFVIENQSNSTDSSTSGSSVTISGQTIGTINNQGGQFQATINLSEVDVTAIKADQKVNLNVDAFPDKTFTGKVLYVNTSGSSNSGVTSYPVTILLDPTTVNIYPKMTVSASVITAIQSDVLLVPSTAVQYDNDQYFVRVMKEGQLSTVSVEIGSSNDSQTVILSGLNQGDEVVSGVVGSISTGSSSSTNTSPFNMFGGNRTPGMGGSVRGTQMIFNR